MTSRWLLWSGAAVAVCIALAVAWVFLPQERIGPAAYDRIKVGMTRQQVEGIIGLPTGDYYTGPRSPSSMSGPYGTLNKEAGVRRSDLSDGPRGFASRDGRRVKLEQWWGDNYIVEVGFGEDGAAVGCDLYDVDPPLHPDLLTRLRSWSRW
jgi:hypothetical protein